MRRRTRGMARSLGRTALIAGTATAVSGRVAARQQATYGQQQAFALQEGAALPQHLAPAPASADVDVVEQLKRFAELRDRGILTEEEFAVQKARLLGS